MIKSLLAISIVCCLAGTTQAEIFALGDLPGGAFNSIVSGVHGDMFNGPIGMSADGSSVVGQSSSANDLEAFLWSQSDGMVGLGDFPGAGFLSSATGVSDDGTVVVGTGRNSNSNSEAFRWTQASGMMGRGDLQGGGELSSDARDKSADGSVLNPFAILRYRPGLIGNQYGSRRTEKRFRSPLMPVVVIAQSEGPMCGFDDDVTYGAGNAPRSVAIGDLDGDLDLDLVTANEVSNIVSVLMNNGDGTFAADVTYGPGNGPINVAIGDLDGDLDLDLAVANIHDDNVSVLLNNGDGTFSADVTYGAGDRPWSVEIGDLDGDLDLDLAVANQEDNNVSVLMNNGDGTFAADVTYGAGDKPVSVTIGDLDGDLDLDLAVANSASDNVSVLLNNGDGTFAADITYGAGDGPISIVIGDLDGDLDLDLAVSNESIDIVSVLMNNGDGTFAADVTYGVGDRPESLAIGDLDGDLDLDLATGNEFSDDVSVLLNNGDGTFATGVTYGVGDRPVSVAIGDLDGDLDLDLVTANTNDDDVSVLLNQCTGGIVEVAPDSVTPTEGDFISGGIAELAESDNLDYTMRRRNADLQSRTEFEVKGTSPTETPTTFEFKLQGAVFARGNVVQTIELFDYDLGVWELVDTSDSSRAPMPDKVVTATPTGDLSRFVETGTMCIEARIRYKSDRNRQKFASNTDQAIWAIGQ